MREELNEEKYDKEFIRLIDYSLPTSNKSLRCLNPN